MDRDAANDGTLAEPVEPSDGAAPRGWIRRLTAQCLLHRRTALGALGVGSAVVGGALLLPLLLGGLIFGS